MSRPSRIAKLSTPRMARILPRPRLFRRLDRSSQRRVLWLVGPPGAGKTALVATWLRNRKLSHLWLQLDEADGDVATFFHYLALAAGGPARSPRRLPAFTPDFLAAPGGYARLFMRALCAGPRRPEVLVLDDYHEVRADSPLHQALRDGLAEIPQGVTVVVLSRSEPPMALARLRANGLLEVILGDELAFTERESQDVAALWGWSGADREEVLALHARTEGWAAGLVLQLAGRRSGSGARRRGGDEQAVFDLFAQEILERLDTDTRRVLLETAMLSRVPARAAARLTGIADAEDLLSRLSRRGSFVTQHEGTYQCHALFRDFLLGRARRALSPERRAHLHREAAVLLEEAGQAAEAFRLYVQASSWADAARTVCAQAPLLLLQGRGETVGKWILCLPEALRENDPWLLLRLGEALSLQDPRAAIGRLERSYELFRAAADATGASLAWADIAETQVFALQELAPLDRWIPELVGLRAGLPNGSAPEAEARLATAAFAALTHRQPWHPDLPAWEARVLALALSPGEPSLRMRAGRTLLLYYGGWLMDLAKARIVIDALGPLARASDADPATTIFWYVGDALHHLFLGRIDACLDAVGHGMSAAAASGLHAWDAFLLQARVLAALVVGDHGMADRTLQEMAGVQGHNSAFAAAAYHHAAFLLAQRRGDFAQARQHGKMCRHLTSSTGVALSELLYGLSCALRAPPASRKAELEGLLHQARRCRSRLGEAASLMGLSREALVVGDEERATALVRDAFACARDLGCLSFVAFEPGELADYCALALAHDTEADYATALIRAQRLPPCERAKMLERWPWDLQIRALGGLAVIRSGKTVQPGRKVQKKPLEMLRYLVARGERGVRQEALSEALWPDAEGDAAHHSLGTTVYRLRSLLGTTEAIAYRDGWIALDPRVVFVDAWALERLLDRLEAARTSRDPDPARIAELQSQVTALHRGDLFGEAEDQPVFAASRERLRRRVERCLDPLPSAALPPPHASKQ